MKLAILGLVLMVSLAVASLDATEYKTAYRPFTYGEVTPSEEDMETMYRDFVRTFKEMEPEQVGEYAHRYEVFKNTVNTVIAHNSNPENSWKMGINEYSDMTDEEFNKHFRLDVTDEQTCSATGSPRNDYDEELPENWDWRTCGVVGPVKNQASCGSCWTFSTIGSLEAHAALSESTAWTTRFNFSEQQLVDCAGDYDCHGCSGGLPSYAFNYIRDNGGIETEESYPYFAKDEECHHDSKNSVVTVEGGFNITAGDEAQLREELYHNGPVSVAFQVVGDFRNYESGVYSSNDCKNSQSDVNHAVLDVGFGVEDGTKYHIIKNSWGATWGNKGYFNIEADVNMCGIAVCNSYPVGVKMVDKFDIVRELKGLN
jgi:cathepsin H